MQFLQYFTHPHWPTLSLIGQQPLVIQVHLMAALAAFIVGAIQILGPKGTALHRILGWGWVIFMMTVAISSLWIKLINHGQFSFIHLFSVVTLIAAPMLVYAARTHNVKRHSGIAIRLYAGALLIAGLFTFFPGRLMYTMFFG